MLDHSTTCFFLKPFDASSWIIGGKAGDCVQMTAAFHEIHQVTGIKPTVISEEKYAAIYDGCSFINPVPFNAPWDSDVGYIRKLIGFKDAVGIQSWHDMGSREFKAIKSPSSIVLQMHGRNFTVDIKKDPHYSAAMMRRAGFSWDEALNLRPVFDLRDSAREAGLLAACWPKAFRKKPLLLVTFDGQSSPWGHLPEAWPVLSPFYRQFHVVDLGKVNAVRVFDMLGLMEAAAGAIVIDTLALHLLTATDTPYIAFTQNGWLGSVPKGNCVLEIKYAQSLRRLREIPKVLQQWLRAATPANSMLVSQAR